MKSDVNEIVIASYKVLLDDAKRLITAAELEWCPDCRGKGIIDPIENPPYKCDLCNGRGWISGYFRNEEKQ